MDDFYSFAQNTSPWLLGLIFFIWVVVLLLVKKIVFRVVRSHIKREDFYSVFIRSADMPLNLLIITSGGVIIGRILSASNAQLPGYVAGIFKLITIAAIAIFLDTFLNAILNKLSGRVSVLRTVGGVARGLVHIVVFGLGLLIVLDSFGISITPLIASLGIGSLAVALALQPTLENFFSGVQILIDRPFLVGHFVTLDSGEEGYVHKIGWRSTWVRMITNNVVVIPNKTMVNTKLLNHYYPVQEMATRVQVGVHYKSDLEHVERVTLEVAKQTLQEVAGGTKTFDPFMRYHTFSDFSINFTVVLRVEEFMDNYRVKHEFIKRLHRRYKQEGITIPYPIRAANYSQEKQFEV